jgi:hypothetical protein
MAEATDQPDLSELPDPPGAPEVERRVHLYPGQRIGIPILFLLPLLALLNVFGERREEVTVADERLSLAVEYPTRLRSGQRTEITVRVTNVSSEPAGVAMVTFGSEYLSRFSQLSFTPSPRHAYHVDLVPGEPGATAIVRLELEGRRPWMHHGEVALRTGEGPAMRVRLRTFVFP